MIRMYEKQSAFSARQVLAVILALILMLAFLPSRAAVAEDEPFIEIEDIEWDENAFVILDDPIYFMGDEDMEVPVITSAGKTNVKVNGVKSKNKLVKYTIPEMLMIIDPNFLDMMVEAEKYIGIGKAMIAFGIALSCNHGCEGCVVFEAKTSELAEHYIRDFGAIPLSSFGGPQRFMLEGDTAYAIVSEFLKE